MKMTPLVFELCFFLVTVAMVAALFALHLLFPISLPLGEIGVDAEPQDAPSFLYVVIDAGHGGADGGAPGPGGINEKDLTLTVSQRLGELLSAAGYRVIYTRSEDIMMTDGSGGSRKMQDMRARLQTARSYPEAVFVSVHMNRFPQESCRGLQVYYSSHDTRSAVLAESVRSTVVEMLQPDNTRSSKDAGSSIYLLDRLEQPAILVECGFLSNPEEARLLANPSYQSDLAFAVFCAIMRYAPASV